ncbi:hypothetical protein G7Y89_g1866 [Cudoniella acicularis]|uniref:6-phosphogluconate dehydrogenase NADP-binding domain-containing protein n=1 Tax=Cudoniella acicularis TaxID=354080 RepID=A0A8H4RUF0_9HELO|nr:hypothetical protein G7Y89_g1866 [Cudoniella acicularis]
MVQPPVGWIGLGSMGIGMSNNLQKYLTASSSPPSTYTNRTLSRGKSLKKLGAVPIETVKELASKCEINFSCVGNDAVLQETTNEIIASGSIEGKIYMDCSTMHPDTSTKIAEQIQKAGGQFAASISYF